MDGPALVREKNQHEPSVWGLFSGHWNILFSSVRWGTTRWMDDVMLRASLRFRSFATLTVRMLRSVGQEPLLPSEHDC